MSLGCGTSTHEWTVECDTTTHVTTQTRHTVKDQPNIGMVPSLVSKTTQRGAEGRYLRGISRIRCCLHAFGGGGLFSSSRSDCCCCSIQWGRGCIRRLPLAHVLLSLQKQLQPIAHHMLLASFGRSLWTIACVGKPVCSSGRTGIMHQVGRETKTTLYQQSSRALHGIKAPVLLM